MSSISIKDIIEARSTTKEFDGSPIEESDISELLNLGIRAPNHHLSQPWTFRVLTQAALKSWLQKLQAELSPEEWKLYQKAAERLQKVGALVFVHMKKSSDEKRAFEDLLAMGACVQNILLGATAKGVGSYWSTARIHDLHQTRTYLNVAEDEILVGGLWLGRGTLAAPNPRIPAAEKTHWFRS